ncbi:MAG TPA: metal ABC transporter permease [Candidatus Saccharimonadales bacterium]|jgi:zinc/manganese transport system permease protein|nr:metal ABC transporter permease [Candidatus Saccharimonadales bacterium]
MFNFASSLGFSLNLWSDLQAMWHYSFMQHAFEAGTIVAIVAGVVGYFVVLRRSSFAAHALSHVGFAGAAGAVLIGLNPLVGLLAFTSGGGVAMALLGRRPSQQDVQIGTVLAFMLGLGVLFISLYKGYATEAYSLLFGEILGISHSDVIVTAIAGGLTLLAMAFLYRRLLFTTLDQDVAEAKGLSILGMNVMFMLLIALATSIAVQVVGVLLIFALMVTPAAIGERLARRPAQGMILAVGVALLATWVGLFISYYQPYPVSFFITSGVFGLYLLVRLTQAIAA